MAKGGPKIVALPKPPKDDWSVRTAAMLRELADSAEKGEIELACVVYTDADGELQFTYEWDTQVGLSGAVAHLLHWTTTPEEE